MERNNIMSNLDQLAKGAQRKADQATRTAGRHQDRVDLWQRKVNNRRPGSAARRRAERQLRHNTKLRDRARRRAQHHQDRADEYRRRAGAKAGAGAVGGKGGAPRRRWRPETPLGKWVAFTLLSAGAVTGIAISGADGFDPFDSDSDIIIEVEDANAPAIPADNGGNGQVNGGGTPPPESEATPTRDQQPRTVPTADEQPADRSPETSADPETPRTDTPGTVSGEKDQASAPAVPAPTTPPAPTPSTPPVQSGPTPEETAYLEAFDACWSHLESYPELADMYGEGCTVDPFGTIGAIDAYLAEVHAEEEAFGAAVDECLWVIDSNPALAEREPSAREDCRQDPYGWIGVYTQLAAEIDAAARHEALVAECFAALDSDPELAEVNSSLIARCSTDPGSALTTIAELKGAVG